MSNNEDKNKQQKFFSATTLGSWFNRLTKPNVNKELQELISKTSAFEKLNFINDQQIQEIMKDIKLSPNFPTEYMDEELVVRCIFYQNSNKQLKYETISQCQKTTTNLRLLCFYYLQNYDHLDLSYLKTVCNVTEKDLNEYFEGVDFETNEKAKILFGICYLHGFGYEVNLEKAFGIFKELSDKGNSYGLFFVGRCYYYGDFVKKDLVESFKYMSLSAEQGNTLGIRGIGLCYEMGEGVDVNYEKALEMYTLAVNKGFVHTSICIGNMFEHGLGVTMDKKKAYNIYHEVSTTGNIDALNILGRCHEIGIGVEVDFEKAFQYYEIGAHLGNPFAQKNLSLCYLRGRGVKEDGRIAFEYCELAAKQKLASAQRILGAFYLDGSYVKEDFELGIEYYKLAAEQGDFDANLSLGRYYEYENIDLKLAFGYYEHAVTLGVKKANYELGRFYLKGIYVDQDVNKAIDLFLNVSDNNEDSVNALKNCLKEDKDLVLETLKRNKSAFQFVSEELQADVEIVWTKMMCYKLISSMNRVKDIKFRFK